MPSPLKRGATLASRSKVTRLAFSKEVDWLNHRAFRFPAKFHPPVARALIEKFSEKGELVLDPFCGSGTMLVESLVAGRHALGYDVDPLAVFVSQAKTRLYDLEELAKVVSLLSRCLVDLRHADIKLDGSLKEDLTDRIFKNRVAKIVCRVPNIPRIEHWFRRRVTLQLCKIRDLFDEHADPASATFLKLCFASIIRNSSNADPVPVSGLEVTSHMLAREQEGRAIDPYELAVAALTKNLKAASSFQKAVDTVTLRCQVATRDASEKWLANVPKADVVITSPPYLNAVDYYRRHTLEMYWLDLVASPDERLELLPRYIGRANPRKDQMPLGRSSTSAIENLWKKRLNKTAPDRARAVEHYAATMQTAIENQAQALKKGGHLVLVVGNNKIGGKPFPTAQLLRELSVAAFEPCPSYWYPIRNRYMSYKRHNGADISTERVIVLKRT